MLVLKEWTPTSGHVKTPEKQYHMPAHVRKMFNIVKGLKDVRDETLTILILSYSAWHYQKSGKYTE